MEFANYFKGMSEEELDEMAKSFALSTGCKKREGLNAILRDYAKVV